MTITSTQSVKITFDLTAHGSPTFGGSTNFPATFVIQKSTDGGSTYSTAKSIKMNPTAANNVDLVTGFYTPSPQGGEPGIMYLSADGASLLDGPSSGSESARFRAALQFSSYDGINSVSVSCLVEVF